MVTLNRLSRLGVSLPVIIGFIVPVMSFAVEPHSFEKLGKDFTTTISPVLKSHCLNCHDTETMEADLDLSRFASLKEVRRDPRVWQKVLRMLADGEMPPKDSRPLSADQMSRFIGWVRSYLNAEAHAGAGDPGRVVVRRLNNVEYNHTIRDLTGIDLQPARQFPPDSVAGEGFANTGESLVMSPALLDKYLEAARQIASHAVLLQDGFRFSALTTRSDWTNELLAKIHQIHQRHTEIYEERDAGNVTRIQWGRVDLAAYVEALLRYRTELQNDPLVIDRVAKEEQLNSTYLRHLSRLLSNDSFSPLLAAVQSQLKTATVNDTQFIVDAIKRRQDQLVELKPVGQMFQKGMSPIDPLPELQTFRVRIEMPVQGSVVKLSLVANDAGDGNDDDKIVWRNPRFERPGTTPLLLRDVRQFLTRFAVFRELTLAQTATYLAAAAESASSNLGVFALAKREKLDRKILRAWIDFLNIQPAAEAFANVAARSGQVVMFVGNDKNPKIGDAGIARYLRSRGHTVSFFVPAGKSAQQQYEVALAHDVVIISESIAATDVRFDSEMSLKDVPRPILSFEPYMYDDAAWTGKAVYRKFGHTGVGGVQKLGLNRPLDSIDVIEIDHPLTLGISGKVKIYDQPYNVSFGVPGNSASVIATVGEQEKVPVTFVYNQGDPLIDGTIAPGMRMGLFLGQAAELSPGANSPTDFDNLTFVGRVLLNAAIEYALGIENLYQPGVNELAENNKYDWPIHYTEVKNLLAKKTTEIHGHEALNGWVAQNDAPSIVANSSDTELRIPGYVRPHGVLVHPSTTHFIAAGWKSPIDGLVRIDAAIADEHPEGGNGQTWALNIQQRNIRQRLGAGEFDRGGSATRTFENVLVRKGDFISLVIGPRNADWACDGTGINLMITDLSPRLQNWNLAADINNDIHVGNPHPDRYGNEKVWHFFSDKVGQSEPTESPLANRSLLGRWRAAAIGGQTQLAEQLADQVATLLTHGPTDSALAADRQLYEQVRASTSPLFRRFDFQSLITRADLPLEGVQPSEFGLQVSEFYADTENPNAGPTNLRVHAPTVIEIKLPADLVAGREFVVDALLASPKNNTEKSAWQGTVQTQVVQNADVISSNGLDLELPILVHHNSAGHERCKAMLDDFRNLLPPMMCCRTIVPLDAVVTIVQFHREDEHLSRLMLNEGERAELERLWNELFFISQDALLVHDSFPLFLEFASQSGNTATFEPLREPIRQRAEEFQQRMLVAEPQQLDMLMEFASRAYRRPLAEAEVAELLSLYELLREKDVSHEEAFRAVLVAICVAPDFLYRLEKPSSGQSSGPVSDWELASRLSYFLWSTLPDESLFAAAKSGILTDPDEVLRQMRRMMHDDRIRSLATEFACQWLGFRDFDQHDGKNERQYPTFLDLRAEMYEESVRFFTDLFQRDGSILEIIEAEHTFLNGPLAKHYGIDGIQGNQWRRVDGMKQYSRGGVLGMATLLAKQSGATRTSPVLRGNWIVETLLGDNLPDPPPTVPELPDSVSRDGLTVREMTEKHVSVAECASCHVRIDPFGFALESFDAIGRYRTKDMLGEPVDTRAKLRDGTTFRGLEGLRSYLLNHRRADFLRQFCRKLLGYSLGRPVELSDEPLIAEMLENLKKNNFHFSIAVETIVKSKQFRYHRGLEATRVR